MTLDQAIQQDKPFTSNAMMRKGSGNSCSRFLMFVDSMIMYFDSDGECGDWLQQYYGHNYHDAMYFNNEHDEFYLL